MLSWHETTRRRVCRTGFFAGCLAPTFLVAGWGLWLRAPDFKRGHEQQLSQQLGLKVSLGGVTYPRPGVTLYEQVELSEPESGRRVAQIRMLELSHADNVLVLAASQPQIDAAHLETFNALVQEQLRGGVHGAAGGLRLTAAEATLRLLGGAQTLTDVEIDLGPTSAGREASMRFRLAGVQMTDLAKLRLVRKTRATPPASGFELNTAGTPLPCSLLAAVWPPAENLGEAATFQGSMWASQTTAGWQGELTGQLRQVDLSTLVEGQFPHKLSGLADVTLARARFRQGRLEQASGSLTAGPGVVGRSLLLAAIETAHCTAGVDPKTLPSWLTYEQLAFSCDIDVHGLTIHGQCQSGPTGALVIDHSKTLLSEPAAQPQPVVNLVRTLVPQTEVLVPATTETDTLLRVLPIPSIVPPPGANPPLPKARVRLKRESAK